MAAFWIGGKQLNVAAEKTGSEIVQILGKTFLLFRPNPDRNDEHRIKLPS